MYLPSLEERKWLGRYLRKLVDRMGSERFLCAAILLPSPRHFPDPWDGTVADVHRLTQRLMHHAGLGQVPFFLTEFDGETDEVWDNGTHGWYGGKQDGRCVFGVNVTQLDDPEAAVGVMVHEVAHAWREHHRLQVEAREREELLTDLTTIYLGFGVFATNDTDRYRSSGGVGYQEWSRSAAGYLPPPAMAWLLAVQAAARADKTETEAIIRHLEPNQRAVFRDALDEIERDPSWLAELNLPNPRPEPWPYRPVAVHDPGEDEVEEVEYEGPDPNRNAGLTVYRVSKNSVFKTILLGFGPGFAAGLFGAMVFQIPDRPTILRVSVVLGIITLVWTFRRTWRYVCSESDCATVVTADLAACPGCGGTLGRTVSEAELLRLRYENLDRGVEEEDCPDCAPEEPCPRHA